MLFFLELLFPFVLGHPVHVYARTVSVGSVLFVDQQTVVGNLLKTRRHHELLLENQKLLCTIT